MTNTYDFRLVALSVLIATLASYTALDLAGRVTAAQGKARIGWLTGGAIAMGTGIWAMHFIGMLAFCLPIPVEYDLLTVLISMLAAIGASGLALFLVSREVMGIVSLLGGSVFMGLGIATMHYTGMVAMRLEASIQYDWLLVTLSVAIAIAVSLVALWLAFKLREANTVAASWRKIGSAIVMGAAVPSMHYTGMAAASFIPIANINVVETRPTINSGLLAIAISIATLIVLGITLLTSFFDRRMYVEVFRADALQQSEKRFRKLAQREELLNRLSSQIRNSLDLNTIVSTAVDEIRSLLQIQRCRFLWYRADVEHPYFELLHEACDPALATISSPDPLQEVATLGETILKLKIFLVADISKDSQLDDTSRNQLASLGLTSLLAVSIQTHTGRVGVVICEHYSELRPWSNNEFELIQAVALQVAIAINQAELYSQSRYATAVAQDQASQREKALSDLQQTQAQLVQTEKMSSLGQMVAGVAHEINNPVNFIYGNLQHTSTYIQYLFDLLHLYQQHFPDPGSEIEEKMQEIDLDFLSEDLPKSLSSMKVGASRIREIVLSLRNFSRLDEAEMKPVDIHDGINSTLLILQHRLQGKSGNPGIKIIKKYGNLPHVECYAGQLNQVFMNILGNAIDALEQKAPLRIITISTDIKSQECQSNVLIRIADNGLGMTEEVKKQLFDPFFTTKPVGNGTGLGLSITYQIVVDKHGGQLHCNSALGQGAEFIIEIPIQQQYQQSEVVNSQWSSKAIL